MPWTSSDTFSTIAIGISLIAAGTSIYQARIARRKEKADAEASDPVFEPEFQTLAEGWPENWLRLSLNVRNRSDTAIVVQQAEVMSPRTAGLHQIGQMSAFNSPPDHPTGEGNKSVNIEVEVRPKGSTFAAGFEGRRIPADTESASLDVYLPRTNSGKRLKLKVTVGRPNRVAKDRAYNVEVDISERAWFRYPPPKPRNR